MFGDLVAQLAHNLSDRPCIIGNPTLDLKSEVLLEIISVKRVVLRHHFCDDFYWIGPHPLAKPLHSHLRP